MDLKHLLPLPLVSLLFVGGFTASRAPAADHTVELTVAAGKHDRTNTPIKVTLQLPEAWKDARTEAEKGHVVRELHFILDDLPAGKSAKLSATLSRETPDPGKSFVWQDNPGKYLQLEYGGKPVLRYIYQAYDDSTQQQRYETYKVFHHLFSPDGERIVTNGPTLEEPYDPKVRYPHHRGIFYGFSKMSYEGVSRVDLWHCQGDNYQSHEGVLASEAGPVLGRHRVALAWHGKDAETFAKEDRELTVYAVPGGHLVEFASRLRSTVGALKIDGDPQHAGFQFRAHDQVAKTTKGQTYYIRVDGVGKPGQTRNWPGSKDQVNLPWKGMSFVLDDQRYTIAYLDRPSNPKEARFSERDYGRFGSYFQYELEGDETLDVNYRLFLTAGDMQPEDIEEIHHDFVHPPHPKTKAE